MTRDDLLSNPQREAAEAVLEERGYENRPTNPPHTVIANEEFNASNYHQKTTACSLIYEPDTGTLVNISITMPYRSDAELSDLDPETAQWAIDYLQSEARVDYSNDGLVQATFEPQETPEETADILEDTAEAMETVADIRGALS